MCARLCETVERFDDKYHSVREVQVGDFSGKGSDDDSIEGSQ